tara:strand:+ start:751 stop:3153 length:2403 start_codon:yes stop_codon:yes gene_type:complete
VPKITEVRETTQTLSPLQSPKYTGSVTPEILAGPEVRQLQSLGKTAEEITDYVVKRQNQLDLDAVTKAENAIKNIQMEQVLMAQKHRLDKATGLGGKAEEFWDSNFTVPEGGHSTPAIEAYRAHYLTMDERQKVAVDSLRARMRPAHLKAIFAHEESERYKSLVANGTAAMDLDIARASMNVYDEETREEAKSSIVSRAAAMTFEGAWAENEALFKQKTAVSAIHTNTIQGFINNQDIASARDYLKKWKGEITGDTSQLEQDISSKALKVEGQQLGEGIFRRSRTTGDTSSVTAEDLLSAIEDPELQDLARRHFKTRVDGEQAADAANLRDAQVLVNQQIYERNEAGEYQVSEWAKVDEKALSLIASQPGGSKNIKELKEAFYSRDEIPDPTKKVEMDAYNELSKMLSSKDTRTKFLNLSLNTKYRKKLTKANLEKFINLQTAMRQKDNEPLESFLTREDIRAGFMRSRKLTLPENEHIGWALHNELNGKVLDEEESTGKKITPSRYSEIAEDVFEVNRVLSMIQKDSRPTPPELPPELRTPKEQIALRIARDKIGEGNEDKEAKFEEAVILGMERVRAGNISRGKGGKRAEPTNAQRRKYMDFLQGDLVMRKDLFIDNQVLAYELEGTPEYEGAYVKVEITENDGTTNDRQISLETLDTLSDAERMKVSTFLMEQGLTPYRVNQARALVVLGHRDKYFERTKSLTTGTLRYKPPGAKREKLYDRAVIYDTMTRLQYQDPTAAKGSEAYKEYKKNREHIKRLYGDEGIEIMDFVIREKVREANPEKYSSTGMLGRVQSDM